jgi:uncharacterized protein YyaL (SSP411 family)
VDNSDLDWIADTLTASLKSGSTSPSAVLFVLRTYSVSGRSDMRDAIEAGLTNGLRAMTDDPDPRRRCLWLGVFAEATAASDDERLVERVRSQLSPTIDGLERFVGSVYEPGEGLAGADVTEQLHSALAFLTAFELTGRLPYSMLAEELLQIARRQSWDRDRGSFGATFVANATAAQLLCRLAALHRDPDYAASAVVAPYARYAADAERILEALAPIARTHLDDVAEYGMALLDWFALGALPN